MSRSDRMSPPAPSADRIAFLVLAHSQPQQLQRLCERLGTDDDIYVHWDRRAPVAELRALAFAGNVQFIEPRLPVFWSDFSVVEATLALMAAALQSGRPYVRLVLLTGACYPIKPIASLRQFFAAARGHNNISYADMTTHWDELAWRIDRYNFRRPLCWPYTSNQITNRYANFPEKAVRRLATLALRSCSRGFRDRFPNLTPYLGSQLFALTPACAGMVMDSVRDNGAFYDYERWTWAPDEHAIQTIVGNSSFETDGVRPYTEEHNLHLGNLHMIRYAFFTIADVDPIQASDKFFMRKIDPAQSAALLDHIDRHVL